MESPDETKTTSNENSENNEKSEKNENCDEAGASNENVKIKRDVQTKTKRVSFHFGSCLSEKNDDVTLTTIQKIYDSKAEINLVQNTSNKTRINKSAYLKLHRHSFSSSGNSSVDKLKGKYENIAKQTDNNNSKVNTVRAKVNNDNSTNVQARFKNEDGNCSGKTKLKQTQVKNYNSEPESSVADSKPKLYVKKGRTSISEFGTPEKFKPEPEALQKPEAKTCEKLELEVEPSEKNKPEASVCVNLEPETSSFEKGKLECTNFEKLELEEAQILQPETANLLNLKLEDSVKLQTEVTVRPENLKLIKSISEESEQKPPILSEEIEPQVSSSLGKNRLETAELSKAETLILSHDIELKTSTLSEKIKPENSIYSKTTKSQALSSLITIKSKTSTSETTKSEISAPKKTKSESLPFSGTIKSDSLILQSTKLTSLKAIKLESLSFSATTDLELSTKTTPEASGSEEIKLATSTIPIQTKPNTSNLQTPPSSPSNKPSTSKESQSTQPDTSNLTTKNTESEKLAKTTNKIEELQSNLSTKLSNDTIAKLRTKYSPASFGYPKTLPQALKKVQPADLTSKIPVPTPRPLKAKSEITSVTVKLVEVSEATELDSFKNENYNDVVVKEDSEIQPERVESEEIKQVLPQELKQDLQEVNQDLLIREDLSSEVKQDLPQEAKQNFYKKAKPNSSKEAKLNFLQENKQTPEVKQSSLLKVNLPQEAKKDRQETNQNPTQKAKPKEVKQSLFQSVDQNNQKIKGGKDTKQNLQGTKPKSTQEAQHNLPQEIRQTQETKRNQETKPKLAKTKPSFPQTKKSPQKNPRQVFFQVTPKDDLNPIHPVEEIQGIELEISYDNIQFAEPEDKHFIVCRSSSEDSIDKLESSLSEFIMDKKPKEKKRSNSFRKILTGGLFGRDRKKSEEEKKQKKKDNAVFADNAQNESQVFDRHTPHRHTLDDSFPRREVQQRKFQQTSGPLYYYSPQHHRNLEDNRYTEMKGNNISYTRQPQYTLEDYVPMDNGNPNRNYMNVSRYIDTSSSSSNTLDSDNRNTYQNALIAQAEMKQLREHELAAQGRTLETNSHEELSRNLELVKPKALIPINSERPLPNPYHNSNQEGNAELKTIERNLNVETSKPLPQKNNFYENNPIVAEETYGTVFDSISPRRSLSPDARKPNTPTSPKSLESSKLRLPSNREKIELQPRIRSPIPQAKVSTEKIIATELLRKRTSPVRSSESSPKPRSPTKRTENYVGIPEIRQSSPHEYLYLNSSPITKNKPPLSPREINVEDCLEAAEWQRKQRELDKSPAFESPKQITTNVLVHVNPEERYVNQSVYQKPPVYLQGYQRSQPSPPRSLHASLNSVRPQTPIRSMSPQMFQQNVSPQFRQNVSPQFQQVSPQFQQVSPQFQQNVSSQFQQNVSPQYQHNLSPQMLQQNVAPQILHQNVSPQVFQPSPQMLQRNTSQMLQPNISSPTLQQNIPYSPRSQTPVQYQQQPSPKSPEKQHIRENVEAFYWRELKKLKEKEEHDLQNYRQHQLNMYGFVEDPGYIRRSRSVSPSLQRGRRSLSLPREVRATPPNGRVQVTSIPEGRPIIPRKPIALPTESLYGQVRQPLQRNPNFIRNTFERSTIGPIGPDYTKPSHAPIFKRGSLTVSENDDLQNQLPKKVSFSSSQVPTSWPTKNGFTKSPPTRRVERESSIDDEVFLPNSPKTPPNRALVEQQRRLNQDYVDYVERRSLEPIYGRAPPKHITVSNKVCDIYGQIHDPNKQNYGQIRQTGYIYGQLRPNPVPNSPVVLRQSYNQLNSPQNNFVRGTRLTASVNDMYKRYPVEQQREAPFRPLPPVPERKDSRLVSARKLIRGYAPISDTESGSEAGEVQRILQSGTKQPNIGVIEEEWNSDGKSGRISGNESGGSRGENEGEIKSGRSRSAKREDPRRHTLSGDQHYSMAGQGGPLSRTMDLEGQFPRGYPPSSNAMLFDDDPGIMSEVETSSTGFRRGGKQRSSLPVVRTPSKTLERPLGLVFLQYRNETKRALLPNEITSIDTVKALFVRSFPKQLSMEYLDSPLVKIYIHDSSKDMFYELEDVRKGMFGRSHLREIRDRSVLRLFESTDVSGGLPMGGVGIPGGIGHFEDPSYFSEPEFDSEYQHQHIHKSKGSAGKGAPYYMGSTTSLPRGASLLRSYSPAVGAIPPDRLKTLPAGAPPKPQRAYSSGATRASDGSSRPPDRFAPFQRPTNPLFNLPDGYMSSPERGSRGYEDPYYSQYTSRSGSITPVIDEEVSDTELLDEQYSLYGVKLAPGGPRGPRSQFPGPAAPPYDTTRLRVEHMERQLANLTGLVQKALTQTPTPRDFLVPPGRDAYRSGDEFDKNSSSSSASLPDDSYLRSDSNKAPKLGKTSCHKSVSFEKSVSFSDEPPDMNSPKQHSPQHAADTKPPKPAIKSSTLPRTSSQEKDRLKPAPPPKPASLSPGQYEGRHIYRDLQLTPEMYNQLRGLQKKAKDLRAEVRNLRRMSQAQAHSVRETIRDTFIKIRAMLMAGGEQVWQAGMDQERVRLSRDEDLYKQEMLRLETDLTDLEASVEELRGNVINRKTRVNMSDVENMALVLSKSSKTVADLKLRFPGLQDSMKSFLTAEMDKVVREEKFLKEEPERLESALRRCKKLTGTLVTLKRLASVQEQRLPCSTGAADGRISPSSISETPPITPTTGQHSKPPSGARVGQVSFGGDGSDATDSNQRPENALDALLDELQTFSKPHPATVNTQMPQASYSDSTPSDPPAIPVKGIPPSHSAHFGHPPMSEIGRKGSMDSASILPTQNLTVSTATGSLRRLHSYPSGSDTDNSPPIQPLRAQDVKTFSSKPPIPERNAELLQHIVASGRRVPPPPPPRTSSKSPLASPTSPSLPPRSPATGLQHIQNVQNMSEKLQQQQPQSQFEAATQNLGLSTLRRNVPNRSSMKDNKAQTLPRNIGSNLQIHTQNITSVTTIGGELQNVSSSSCESVNSQDGTKKGSRKEELEQRHQELLKKQKALQEQYARLQQLQRGNNTLAVVPPTPDQLLKKTGSESNLLQKMGLQMATAQMTGSLTHLPSTTTSTTTNSGTTTSVPPPTNATTTENTAATDSSTGSSTTTTTTNKVYETDIL